MAEVRGVYGERFGAVRQAPADSPDQDDVGASAAVYLNGEAVVDIWGRYADAAPHGVVGAGRDHERVFDDQDDGGLVRAAPG